MPTEPNWRWPNFSPDELRCKHTGEMRMDPAFLDRLQRLRSALGFALPVTSGFRSPSHPEEAKKARPGAHAQGRAVDIAIGGPQLYTLLTYAPALGFTGLGVSQRDGQPRFVHLDDISGSPYIARPMVWSY
ncbi:MAG: DUF882 domain-containing protein [Alphaproteobacteria bacterium]|nr:DUF882 domain-containing protein [Alphaproteobacteria bacterium]